MSMLRSFLVLHSACLHRVSAWFYCTKMTKLYEVDEETRAFMKAECELVHAAFYRSFAPVPDGSPNTE